MIRKYMNPKWKAFRIALLIYCIIFFILFGFSFVHPPIYDVSAEHTLRQISFLGHLSVFNMLLIVGGIAYNIFCIIKKYFIDIAITIALQVSLFFCSSVIFIVVGVFADPLMSS